MAVLAAIQTALDDGINDVSANLAQQGSDGLIEHRGAHGWEWCGYLA